MAFTLDRYGHLYGDRDAAQASKLDAVVDATDQAETGGPNVVEMPVRRGSA